jgi:hypothetical protein
MRLWHSGLTFLALVTCSAFQSVLNPSTVRPISRRRTPVVGGLFKKWRNNPSSSGGTVGMDIADEFKPVVGGQGLNAFSKPITVEKYEKLQSRRVVVTITCEDSLLHKKNIHNRVFVFFPVELTAGVRVPTLYRHRRHNGHWVHGPLRGQQRAHQKTVAGRHCRAKSSLGAAGMHDLGVCSLCLCSVHRFY